MVEIIQKNAKILRVENVSQWFGDTKVLNDVDFEIAQGEVVSLVGPSGCGKSTLFKAILATHPAKAGEIWVNDKLHTKPSRDVGIVYQDYRLMPFLTAIENVAEGLKLDQTSIPYRFFKCKSWSRLRKQHLEEAKAMLEKVGLGDKASLYPADLSGGQKQRVAIAQALITKPSILLLDEPFGAADVEKREDLQDMLMQLYRENIEVTKRGEAPAYTILIVTHELLEALSVADRVLGLSQHHVDGKNGATIVYDKPATIFHPGFDRELLGQIAEQEAHLRSVVFDPNNIKRREENVNFWAQYQAARAR